MKIAESIVATTHIDKHNDRLTLTALEGMAEQIEQEYLPLFHEHDPRIPPHGRVISAKIEELEDGEYALKCQIQLFEPGDEIRLSEDGREIPLMDASSNKFDIVYDYSYGEGEDQKELDDLVTLIDGNKREYGKKGLEPISVLIIASSFILGNFALGFLQKMGADTWDQFKSILKRLARRKRSKGLEYIFQFQFVISLNGKAVSIEVNITNPNDADIDRFLKTGIPQLDKVLPRDLTENTSLRKVVYNYSAGKLLLSYAIRKDAVPLLPKPMEKRNRQDRKQKDNARPNTKIRRKT
jgi:hypothetical protein